MITIMMMMMSARAQPTFTAICLLSLFHHGDAVSTQSEEHIRETISRVILNV